VRRIRSSSGINTTPCTHRLCRYGIIVLLRDGSLISPSKPRYYHRNDRYHRYQSQTDHRELSVPPTNTSARFHLVLSGRGWSGTRRRSAMMRRLPPHPAPRRRLAVVVGIVAIFVPRHRRPSDVADVDVDEFGRQSTRKSVPVVVAVLDDHRSRQPPRRRHVAVVDRSAYHHRPGRAVAGRFPAGRTRRRRRASGGSVVRTEIRRLERRHIFPLPFATGMR
jgi:hypothetical protein